MHGEKRFGELNKADGKMKCSLAKQDCEDVKRLNMTTSHMRAFCGYGDKPVVSISSRNISYS
jgi:hypothetical protein